MLNLNDEEDMIDVVVWHELYTRSYAVLASSEGLRVIGTAQANYGVFSIIASGIERVNFCEGCLNSA